MTETPEDPKFLPHKPQSFIFELMDSSRMKALSTVKITNLTTFDMLGYPAKNGLHDLRMGAIDNDFKCTFCHLKKEWCRGHFGRIELPQPVFNPVLIMEIYRLLKLSCLACHQIMLPTNQQLLFHFQLWAIKHGLFALCHEMEDFTASDHFQQSYKAEKFVALQQFTDTFSPIIQGAASIEGVKETEQYQQAEKQIIRNIYLAASKVKGRCPQCNYPKSGIRKSKSQFIATIAPSIMKFATEETPESPPEFHFPEGAQAPDKTDYLLTPLVVKKHFRLLYQMEGTFLQQLYGALDLWNCHRTRYPTDAFFLDVVMVTPNYMRPVAISAKGRVEENPQTLLYRTLLGCSLVMEMMIESYHTEQPGGEHKEVWDKVKGDTREEKMLAIYNRLQTSVNHIFDTSTISQQGKNVMASVGIRQVIEKKGGILRSNIMAKRVNFCARSVIVPDPLIEVGQVGIPENFARKLTFRELVFPHNLEELQQLVMNGPKVYPGALSVEIGDKTFEIPAENAKRRQFLAMRLAQTDNAPLQKVARNAVHRNLVNGDWVLINRQPTLHRPSLMAHQARVLPQEKTLRLHYANCKSYNADFDGDELNCHFPQNHLARAEAATLAAVQEQFLSPKDGSPLSGLIQDHVLTAVYLTLRGTILTRKEYTQLVGQAMPSQKLKKIRLQPPAYRKPGPFWSGKQVISTIILNMVPEDKALPNLRGKAKIEPKFWETRTSRAWLAGGAPFTNPYTMSESEVIFREGELVCGILDKSQLGTSYMGLFHLCYELYGGKVALDLESGFSRMLNHALERNLFSVTLDDLNLSARGWKKLSKMQEKFKQTCRLEVNMALGLDPEADPQQVSETLKVALLTSGSEVDKLFDKAIKSVTGPFTKEAAMYGRDKGAQNRLLHNRLALMVYSGAKGSGINLQQITTLVGQVEVEGKRIQNTLNGKTLPIYDPYDPSPQNGGFCMGNLTRGLKLPESTFHAMAAREGMCDTAVKTATSGYLQRCLVKSLESLHVAYDNTVRDGAGSIVQFLYGGDGLSPIQCQMLKKNNFQTMFSNYQNFLDKEAIRIAKERSQDSEKVKTQKKLIKNWYKNYGNHTVAPTPFTLFVETEYGDTKTLEKPKKYFEKKWRQLSREEKQKYIDAAAVPHPVISVANPATTFGCVSQDIEEMIDEFVKTSPEIRDRHPLGKKEFRDMVYYKYQRSLAEPGEPVGILAAQSIGEPSTQMTLNTFHFAGKADMNMTLGIPRLKEVIMTATANLSTPTMRIYFQPESSKRKMNRNVQHVLNYLTPVHVGRVIHKMKIGDYLVKNKSAGKICLGHKVRLTFLPPEFFEPVTVIKHSHIIPYLKKYFVPALNSALHKAIEDSKKHSLLTVEKLSAQDDEYQDVDSEEPEASIKKGSTDVDLEEVEEEDVEVQEEDDEAEEKPEEEEEAEEENEEAMEVESNVEEEEILLNEEVVAEEEIREVINKLYIEGITYTSKWFQVHITYKNRKSRDLNNIISTLLNTKYMHQVPGIKRAFVSLVDDKNGAKEPVITTEGVNIKEIAKLWSIIDLPRLYTNDIHLIAKTYGIEMAYKSIVNEVENIFTMYGIDVDHRHLSLVADYMVHLGTIRGCNYRGISTNPSVMQKMSFERATATLTDAVLRGTKDNFKSVSSCVAFGVPVKVGTGSFELIDKK